MATRTFSRSRPPSELTLKAEALLVRYPKLDAREIGALIGILPRLRILDLGMMAADDQLAEKLAAFEKDHGDQFKMPKASMIAFLAVPTLLILAGLWAVLSPGSL